MPARPLGTLKGSNDKATDSPLLALKKQTARSSTASRKWILPCELGRGLSLDETLVPADTLIAILLDPVPRPS